MNFKKVKSLSLSLILFFGIYISFTNNVMASDLTSKYVVANPEEMVAKPEEVKKTILIDPGHGGYDAGASSKNGISEKGINLNIGLKLREKLTKMGYDIAMTREDDKALNDVNNKTRSKKAQDLSARCKMKMDTQCDLFISIHLNSFPQEIYSGAQVWYSKSSESKILAQIVQGNLKNDLNKDNKRVQKPAFDQYRILKGDTTMPSVIVECGFLSNPTESAMLNTDSYQDKIATSLAKSIKEYFTNAHKS